MIFHCSIATSKILEGLGTRHCTKVENTKQIPEMVFYFDLDEHPENEYFQDVHPDQNKDVSELLPMKLQSKSLLLR